ncbi:MAG: carboxypeptidase-like regulatory domain-containing protein [Chloroflexota bacterium]
MKLQFIAGVLILLMATCSAQPASADSGVEGKVLIGPNCPVAQQGQDCPDKPYQATLSINNPDGRLVAQIKTDEKGHFKVPLDPGDYILHPETPNMLPFAGEQTFTVHGGKFTQLTVTYDSGIR